MSTDVKVKYASVATIVCTCSGIADNSARESTALDNSSNLYMDAFIQGSIAAATAALTTNPIAYVRAYAGLDGGTTFTGNASGSDAAMSNDGVPQKVSNCPIVGTVPMTTMSQTYESDVFSIAAAFGGVLPDRWGIVLENQTGQAILSAKFMYMGIYGKSS